MVEEHVSLKVVINLMVRHPIKETCMGPPRHLLNRMEISTEVIFSTTCRTAFGELQTSSRCYVGKFECGKPHGNGTLYYHDGSIDFYRSVG
jgi:hypothetical protein